MSCIMSQKTLKPTKDKNGDLFFLQTVFCFSAYISFFVFLLFGLIEGLTWSSLLPLVLLLNLHNLQELQQMKMI